MNRASLTYDPHRQLDWAGEPGQSDNIPPFGFLGDIGSRPLDDLRGKKTALHSHRIFATEFLLQQHERNTTS
jgi:hypothetical protein